MKKVVCNKCGSGDVTVTVTVNPNDTAAIRDYCHRDGTIVEDGWCNGCGDYVELETVGEESPPPPAIPVPSPTPPPTPAPPAPPPLPPPALPPVDPWRCEECGSKDVQQRAWVDINDGENINYDDCDRNDYYCNGCSRHNYLVQESELMKTIEDWFADHLRPDDDKVISGLRRDDFASDEEYAAACKAQWDARDVESKIHVWHELTRDKSDES